MATRWDERNVNAQCVECNRYGGGNPEGYRRGLVNKYGPEVVEELEARRHATVKLSRSDITTRIIMYRNKMKLLK